MILPPFQNRWPNFVLTLVQSWVIYFGTEGVYDIPLVIFIFIMIVMWFALFILMCCLCTLLIPLLLWSFVSSSFIKTFLHVQTLSLLAFFQILAFMLSGIVCASINVHLFLDDHTPCLIPICQI